MRKLTKLAKITASTLLLFVIGSGTVSAALFHGVPSYIEAGLGDDIVVDFYIDTEGQNINAIEGIVTYDERFLTFVETHEANSIVSFWVEQPSADNSRLKFSGIIPGGYEGLIDPETNLNEIQKGLVLKAIFRAKEVGTTSIDISNIDILAHDGTARSLEVDTEEVLMGINEQESGPDKYKIEDVEAPEILNTEIYKDIELGGYFLSILAKDGQTGVSHIEIKSPGGEWSIVDNPHYLGKQKPSSLEIKVVDKAGNIAIVNIDNWQYGWLILVSLLIILAVFMVTNGKKNRNKK